MEISKIRKYCKNSDISMIFLISISKFLKYRWYYWYSLLGVLGSQFKQSIQKLRFSCMFSILELNSQYLETLWHSMQRFGIIFQCAYVISVVTLLVTYAELLTEYVSFYFSDLLHIFSYLPRDLNFLEHTSSIGWKEWESDTFLVGVGRIGRYTLWLWLIYMSLYFMLAGIKEQGPSL